MPEIRLTRNDFPQLKEGNIYVDWTGAALPPAFLIHSWAEHLSKNLYGNPHSHRETASHSIDQISDTRLAILQFLNASPEEYEVIFTSNATNAILLLQHFKFTGGELLLTADNHNSVNGLREIARNEGAVVRYIPVKDDLAIDESILNHRLENPRTSGNRLFCYPAKSNYSGTVHPIEWVETAQRSGWSVLLDAAAFLANDRLDLSVIKPDFVPVSFYKIFGFPTGIGCLVIRKRSYEKMYKRWFSGGSILIVSVKSDFYAPEASGYARYEDGTINFALIPAISHGLKFIESLGDRKANATTLAAELHKRLSGMSSHDSSVCVHNRSGNDIICFSIKKNDKIINPLLFEDSAQRAGIYVRTGCFCNPGINEKIFNYSVDDYEHLYNDGLMPGQADRLKAFSETRPLGAIRVSFGYANDMNDVIRFEEFTREFISEISRKL